MKHKRINDLIHRRFKHTSGIKPIASNVTILEINEACDKFLKSRNLPIYNTSLELKTHENQL